MAEQLRRERLPREMVDEIIGARLHLTVFPALIAELVVQRGKVPCVD